MTHPLGERNLRRQPMPSPPCGCTCKGGLSVGEKSSSAAPEWPGAFAYPNRPRCSAGFLSHRTHASSLWGSHSLIPNRYHFLEGRGNTGRLADHPAAPWRSQSRGVLHLLIRCDVLQVKVSRAAPRQKKKKKEARRGLFSRAGSSTESAHNYEGLLDHSAFLANRFCSGLASSRKKPIASITVVELEHYGQQDRRI